MGLAGCCSSGSGGSFAVNGDGSSGECTIAAPFAINNRFFSATGIDGSKATVVTLATSGTNTIKVRRSQENVGVLNGDDGLVSILIY